MGHEYSSNMPEDEVFRFTKGKMVRVKEEGKQCSHLLGITFYKDEMMEFIEKGITLTRALAHLKNNDEPNYSVDWFKYCPRCGEKNESIFDKI